MCLPVTLGKTCAHFMLKSDRLLGKHEIFAPIKTHPPMTVRELAATASGDSPMETA